MSDGKEMGKKAATRYAAVQIQIQIHRHMHRHRGLVG